MAGLGLAAGYGAGAASDALEAALKEQIQRKVLAQKLAQQEFENRQTVDAMTEKQREFDQTQGLNRDEFGLKTRQYDEGKPQRDANVSLTGAQTGNLNSETASRDQTRQFAASDRDTANGLIAGLSDTPTAPGGVGLRTIAGLKQSGGLDLTTPGARASMFSPQQLGTQEGQADLASYKNGGRQIYADKSAIAADNRPQKTEGRPVLSSSANRISELDTSINDLATLRQAITPKQGESSPTGTAASIGAALPNWVSNSTGIGIDAKQKQSTIDRVKQVIGKALEGGVLRKEDEYKYEKILPTIADSDQVVATKLNGLDAALAQRRDTEISALEDAGYDMSKYRQRDASKAHKSDGPAVGTERVINGTQAVWDGKGWKAK